MRFDRHKINKRNTRSQVDLRTLSTIQSESVHLIYVVRGVRALVAHAVSE